MNGINSQPWNPGCMSISLETAPEQARLPWLNNPSRKLEWSIVHFQNKHIVGSEDEQSFITGPETEHRVIGIQVGYLLLGNLSDLSALFPVKEYRVDRRGLAVNEDSSEAFAQSSVWEVGCTSGKLFITFRSLNVTWIKRRIKNKTF